MGKYGGAERRKYVRFTPEEPIPVKFTVIDQQGVEAGEGDAESSNVSGGGMFLEIPPLDPTVMEQLILGQKFLSLEIDVPELEKPIRAIARVIWVEKASQGEGYGVGVEFVKITEGDRQRVMDIMIDRYLKREE